MSTIFAKNNFSKINTIFLFFFLYMCSGLILADSSKNLIREGLTFYDKGNYADALQRWKSASEVGSREADFLLGFLYDGVLQNDKEALSFSQKQLLLVTYRHKSMLD